MNFVDTPVSGTIIPIATGTRLRNAPTTKGSVITSYGPLDKVEVDLVREYKETVLTEYVTIGDLWGRVVKVNGVSKTGWMAIKYYRVTPPNICNPDYIVSGDGEGEPTPIPVIPKLTGASITLRYDNGKVETEELEVVKIVP